MRINRIKLYNISSYSGACEFDFTVSQAHNIVLIGGQNGTGKTSLFTAIKLALYGPLCFHFQSKNNQYTARVKELISHDAFAQEEVRAYIELEIELPRDQELIQYTIRREWSYEDKKLEETDSVWEDGRPLEEEETGFFQNYLYHVLPPNLFDFFFFDGEEIAGFFSTPGYHSYLREAVLTLDHYDTFGLIEKFSRRYVVNEEDSEKAGRQREEYEEICNELDRADEMRQARESRIQELQARIDGCEQELFALENRFKKAGGLPRGELDRLNKKTAELERRREQINLSLKNYMEETAPLVLTAPVAEELRAQLALEQQVQQYRAVSRHMSPQRLEAALAGILPTFGVERREDFILALSRALDASVKPDLDLEGFAFLHDLSQEQRDAVGEVLSRLERVDREALLAEIREKDEIGRELSEIRKVVESSIAPEERQVYEKRQLQLELDLTRSRADLQAEQDGAEEYEKRLVKLENRRKSLRTSLVGATRKIEAKQYTERLSDMMHEMLAALLEGKRREIEAETLRLSKEILRKEHFIDLIELDEKFDFCLYREQAYTYEELSALFANIGSEDLSRRIGADGVKRLQELFHVDTVSGLKKVFKNKGSQSTLYDGKRFDLYKRLEFQQFSKGEKQIFILSLYWAIIKTSGRDIPFIIDTPFARIDTEHREQIAKKFFPNISAQVIILSTDEEITQPYYDVLRPYIAQEYTLSYNEKLGQTEVLRGYSFGGSAI